MRHPDAGISWRRTSPRTPDSDPERRVIELAAPDAGMFARCVAMAAFEVITWKLDAHRDR
jgi:hypothetical protein